MNEHDFMDAVGRIHADEGLKARVMALRGAPRRKPVLKYAVSFALAAAVVCGFGFWPQGAVEQNAGAESGSVPAPRNGFAVMVNAAEKDGAKETELAPGKTFTLETDGDQSTRGSGRINPETGKYEYLQIYQFSLKCVGDGIRTVSYETDKGIFEQKVGLAKSRIEDQKEQQSLIGQGFERLFSTKKDKTTQEEQSWGFKPLGTSFTEEQGNGEAGSLFVKYSIVSDQPIEPTEQEPFVLSERLAEEVEGTRITMTAVFEDGSRLSKTVALSTSEHGLCVGATLVG